MQVTPLVIEGRQLVQSYGGGGFSVSGVAWRGSVLVMPERTLAWAPVQLAEATLDSLAAVLEASPRIELVLLGGGASMRLPPAGLREALKAKGIAVDLMDSGAACRTFNVLMGENRRAAAAIIAI